MATIHEINEDWQREGLSPTWVKLQQAQAEFDALAADAARYRWLREFYCPEFGRYETAIDRAFRGFIDAELDAAIDAAMKGE